MKAKISQKGFQKTPLKTSQLGVGLLQYRIDDDFSSNRQRVFSLLSKIKSPIPHLIVLPEMWLGGPRHLQDQREWAQHYQLALSDLQEWCRRQSCGSYFSQIEHHRGKFYNTAYLIDTAGRVVGRYRKVHLFSLGGERKLFAMGQPQLPWKFLGVQWGGVICYDIRFPEQTRFLALNGAKILLVCAQWPQSRSEHWKTLLKARAIENQCYVVACNRLGKKNNETYQGDSMVIDPWGKSLLKLKPHQKYGQVVLDMELLHQIRSDYPFLKEYLPMKFLGAVSTAPSLMPEKTILLSAPRGRVFSGINQT